MDEGMLAGRVALVTGAGRGIGRAVALELAACGAEVCFTNLDAGRGAAVRGEIEALGRQCLALQSDCGEAQAAEAVAAQVLDRFGRIDVLVNNAGITKDGLLLRMSAEDWREVLRVNLDGMFYMTRPVARAMVRARYGRIINLTSVVGFRGNAGQVNYSSAKAAVVGFTKSVARELGGRGITCNAVAPGFIATDMTAALAEKPRAALLASIPLGRMGTAEEVAKAVRFLACSDASYISGSILHVNGGMH